MSATRAVAGMIFCAVLTGTFATAKPGDLEILAKVGQASVNHVKSGLPETNSLPFGRFRPADALPIEERVRLRLQTDKDMSEIDFRILATPTAGEVKLQGVVSNANLKAKALEVASRTVGVTAVIDELAIPEK